MQRILYFFSSLILLFSVSRASAGQVPESHAAEIREGINLLYNTEYNAALEKFDTLLPEYKEHPAPWFFRSMVYWIKCNDLQDMEASGKLFKQYIAIAIEQAEIMLQNNPDDPNAYFYLAGSLGFQGRFYLFSNEWYQAILYGLKAYDLLMEAERKQIADNDIKLGLGIFNYFAGRLPGGLAKAAKFFGISGDMHTGLRQLEEVAKEGNFASVEAEIMLASIYTYYTRRPARAVAMFSNLAERYPKNPYFHIALAEALLYRGNREEAETKALANLVMLENGEINANWSFRVFSQLGKYYYTIKEYKTALQYLNKALSCPFLWPDDYVPWAHLRRAHILKHYNFLQLAEVEYKKVIEADPTCGPANTARRILNEMRNAQNNAGQDAD